MKIAIIDFESGNLKSVFKAVEFASKRANLNSDIQILNSNENLKSFDKIILPGQGSFKQCYNSLSSIDGMLEGLNEAVLNKQKPILGICVGMQLFSNFGEEDGGSKGFGWIKGDVKKIQISDNSFKLPHMGWNNIEINPRSRLLKEVENESHFYFVHSYRFDVTDRDNVSATTNYSEKVDAVVEKNNIFGTQFHPEKSQENGIKILENFIRL